ncbi:MAG: hypothetical protein KGL52_09745 [Rhodospirillales bacterium]|nr:hypothetical protein [Rhodospirillales bacterium]
MAAISAPVLLLVMSMGIEVAHWSVAQIELQRSADMAALAGASALARNASVQQAASAAADVAEVDNITGTAARSWDPAALVLSDNNVTVTITNGVHNAADPAVLVAARQQVPLWFSRILTFATGISLGSTAMAELGPQPCILTLGGSGTGLTASGNPVIDLNGCSAYSDSTIKVSGSATFDASALYAGGTISIGSNVTGTATNPSKQVTGATPLPDPYANDQALQSALSRASCAPAQLPAVSGNTVTLDPNTCYGSISISGSQVLSFNGPGLYTINGSLKVSGNTGTSLSGSGITVVSTGAVSITGNFNSGTVSLTAATVTTAQNGAVPGVLFATTSTQSDTIGGGTPVPFTGLIYTPNASLSFSGTPMSGGTGCAKIIAKSVTVVGNANLASTCSSYQLTSFGNIPNASLIQLVE